MLWGVVWGGVIFCQKIYIIKFESSVLKLEKKNFPRGGAGGGGPTGGGGSVPPGPRAGWLLTYKEKLFSKKMGLQQHRLTLHGHAFLLAFD